MGCTSAKSKHKQHLGSIIYGNGYFNNKTNSDNQAKEIDDNPNNLHVLSGGKSTIQNINSNDINMSEILKDRDVLSRMVVEEGFEEKIKHIEKVFEQLLESNDNKYDMCSVSDQQLTDFLLSHKHRSMVIDTSVPLSSTPDIPGEQISAQMLMNSQFQMIRSHIINDVLKAEYVLLAQQTSIRAKNEFQIVSKIGQVPQKILEESDESLKNWKQDISQDNNEQLKQLNDGYSSNQHANNFPSNPGNSSVKLQNGSNLFNKNNIDQNSQQQQQYRPKQITLLATHFDAEEELVPQIGSHQKKNNGSYKNAKPKQSLLRANSHSSFTDKAKQRISVCDFKRPYSPSNYGMNNNINNRNPLAGGSVSQLPSTKEYGGDVHGLNSLNARSTNFNEITLQEIDQDFKDNSNKLQCQFSLFALKSIGERINE